MELKEIDEKILEAQTELEKLQQQRKNTIEAPEDERLADFLHEKLCHWNHTDGCSWHYETADGWNGQAHIKYLKKARRMLQISDYDSIVKIIKISKEF